MSETMTTTMVLISQNEWNEVKNTLLFLRETIATLKPKDSEDKVMNSKEAMKYLNISAKTWQTYRDNKLIPFSQCGRKIMVKKSDLDAFLSKHRREYVKCC